MRVKLRGKQGNVKEAKVGFSWTVFFFSFFVPFIRGDLKWGVIMLIVQVVISAVTVGMGMLFVSLAFAVFYNKTYINELLNGGYEPASEIDADILRQKL